MSCDLCVQCLFIPQTRDGYYVTLTSGTGGGDAFGMRFLDPKDYAAGWKAGKYSYLKPAWLKGLGYNCATQAGTSRNMGNDSIFNVL